MQAHETQSRALRIGPLSDGYGPSLSRAPTTIEQRQRELEVVYEDLFPEVAEQTENAASSDGKTNEVHHQNGEPTNFAQTTPSKLDDDALIQKAREAKGGAEFAALFDRGDTSAYSGDASAADLALMNRLAFWLDRDANRMEASLQSVGAWQAGQMEEPGRVSKVDD